MIAPHTTRRPIALLLALALLTAVLVACSDSSDEASRELHGRSVSEAEFRYGAAPDPPSDTLTYQPNVVLVGGGPAAVREMSGDGLTVTLDPDASGVAGLAVDQVLFASGRVVGRVLAVEDRDGGRVVTLGPVELTDVYETLEFDTTTDLDPAALAVYTAPAMPNPVEPIDLLPDEEAAPDGTDGTDETEPPSSDPGSSDPDSTDPGATEPDATDPGPDDPNAGDGATEEGGSQPFTGPVARPASITVGADADAAAAEASAPTIELPRVQFVAGSASASASAARPVPFPAPANVAQATPPVPPLPLPLPSPTAIGTGDFKIQPVASGGIGAQFTYDKNGTTIRAKVLVAMRAPKVKARLNIRNKNITAALELSGGAGFEASFEAGTKLGLDANVDANIALPVDLTIPVGGTPAPFSLTISQRLLVKSAFSAKNSTLKASGKFAFDGAFTVGIVDGNQTLGGPTSLTVEKSLMDSARGITIGPGGIIIGHAMRVMLGIGAFGLATGLYVDFITSFSITRGSDLGLVLCKGGSLDMVVGGGVGYSIPQPIVSGINLILRALNLKQIERIGGLEFARTTLIHLTDTKPASKICTG